MFIHFIGINLNVFVVCKIKEGIAGRYDQVTYLWKTPAEHQVCDFIDLLIDKFLFDQQIH